MGIIKMLHNPDTQIANCTRALVRYIIQRNLSSGAKLPAQEDLRRQLGFSHNSMTPAMNLLVESGMLERKPRQGTIIRDPAAIPAGLWRIAFPFGILDNSPSCQFETILIRYLQEKCYRALCHMRYYILNVDKVGKVPHELNDFGLLQNDIRENRIDGILTPAFFSSEASTIAKGFSVPLCNIGGWQETPIRVSIDSRRVIAKGLEELQKRGCRNISIIFNYYSQQYLLDFIDKIKEEKAYQNMQIDVLNSSISDADYMAGKLKKEKRTEGLILLNDIFALELVSKMTEFNYSPSVVVQSNRQIPLFFPIPVIKVEFDIEVLAETGMTLLLDKIKRLDCDPTEKNIEPKIVDYLNVKEEAK